jgi:hypothetical protein
MAALEAGTAGQLRRAALGMTEIWKLYDGEERIADLAPTGGNFPWLEGELRPEPGFERFRELFDEQQAATDAGDWDKADPLYYRIRDTLTLVDPEGTAMPEFLLQIKGSEAWWRWSETPFDED